MRRVHTVLAHLFPLTLGVACGLLACNLFGVTLYAQSNKLHADPALVCTWDQPAASLGSAQTMHVQTVLDNGAPTASTQTCTGAASPFQCHVPLTATMQVVGVHSLLVQGANVDPVDGSLSQFVTLVSVPYEIVPPLTPPSPGSNGRIIKLVGGLLVAGLITFLSLFGHH